ncbi:hypothetical protein D3C81_530470 [compost metagenome]
MATQGTGGIPLAGLGFIDNAAVLACKRHPLPTDGRADIADIPNSVQTQPIISVDHPLIKIADACLAVDVQPLTALQRAGVVTDVATVQVNLVARNHAAAQRGDVSFGQVQFWCQHRLAVDRHLLPPDDAVLQL